MWGRGEVGGAFRLLLSANPLPMWVYDLGSLRFLEVNEAAVAHYGYSREAFLAMTIADIRPAEDLERLRETVAARRDPLQFSGSWRHRRGDGSLIDVEVTSHLLDWEGRPAALVVAQDVTEARRLEKELARRELFDEATGLANAALFADRAAAALARAGQSGAQVAVLVVGLGALEEVASTVGDEAADAVVAAEAQRLYSCCGPRDTVGRLGGGRFAVLREAPSEVAVLSLADSVVSALGRPVAVPGWGEVRSGVSVGVALAGADLADAASLVRGAGAAMRHAAERGGGFMVFHPELRRAALEAFETAQALADATSLGQLRVHYQPIVGLSSGEPVACEALVRWQRPGVGLVGPDLFVPVAERNGLIVELGGFVIDRAVADAASWPETSGGRPKVAVNLSARQFGDSHLVERFSHACAACGVPPGSVGVELTESAFVATDDYGAYQVLAALREMGVEVAVDDFGTGYSALSYLKHLPVDVIKIDRSFVAGLGVDRADMLVVEAVARVAQGLGLRVIAEGVETPDQLDALRQLGCDAAQGYLLARPVPNDQLPGALDHARQAVARVGPMSASSSPRAEPAAGTALGALPRGPREATGRSKTS